MLTEFLKGYAGKFSKNIDEVWDLYDRDSNGYLDKTEVFQFLQELSKSIDKERAENYDPSLLEKQFS